MGGEFHRAHTQNLIHAQYHLKHTLIIDLVEDGAIDLVGFQCSPVEDRKAELGFYGFLDAYGYER